jgi:hypothetical protein
MARLIRHAGDGGVGGLGDRLEAGRQLDHPVAVAHPHIQQAVALGAQVVLDPPQQGGVAAGAHLGVAVFVMVGVLHPPAELGGQGLHPVADAEQRHPEIEHRLRAARGLSPAVTDSGPPERMMPLGWKLRISPRPRPRGGSRNRPGLAHPAGDELGVLGAEVEDQDAVS